MVNRTLRSAPLALMAITALSCRAAPPTGRFDASLGFVSNRLESLWLADCTSPRAREVMPWQTEGVDSLVVAGGKFRPRGQRGSWFEGDSDSVWVWDVGSRPLPEWWLERRAWITVDDAEVLAEWRLHVEQTQRREVVAGVDMVSIARDERGDVREWFAVLGERFLVRTTSKELMVEAIGRAGANWQERAEAMRLPVPVRPDASIVVARRYGEPDPEDVMAPFGEVRRSKADIDCLVVEFAPDGKWRCVVRTTAPQRTVRWLQSLDVVTDGHVLDGKALSIESHTMLDSAVKGVTLLWLFGSNLIL